MRKSFALVYNARAGIARPRLLDGVLAFLKSAGAEVYQLPARSAEEAAERVRGLAKSGGPDAVIAAGGDGTFRAVATGAAGSAMPVGFLPLGTGNILAYEIGTPKRVRLLAENFLSNPTIAVRGGLVNGAAFFLMVGAGFDAGIVGALSFRAKRAVGRVAYTVPVLKTLARGPSVFDVRVDGIRHDATWVIVTRASHYGGAFVLTRDTQLGCDPMLAILIDARSRAALARASAALCFGRLGAAGASPEGVKVFAANRVIIGVESRVPLQVDGDEAGTTPAEILADGPVVNLIVPPAYVADLTNRHTNHLDSNP